MNSIKKSPLYFSLNLGKILKNGEGKNPKILYYKLSDSTDLNSVRADGSIFCEYVLDCFNLTRAEKLRAVLLRLKAVFKDDFTIRTLLVKDNSFEGVLAEFLENIRIIESPCSAALKAFPDYKTRLSVSSRSALFRSEENRFYIYRNPLADEMNLPFEKIGETDTEQYEIIYHKNGKFLYTVYKDKTAK